MKNPKIETKVVHSQSKPAWNVIGTVSGLKYKIARCPYVVDERYPNISDMQKEEAREHAEFISYCFNHANALGVDTITPDTIKMCGELTWGERKDLLTEDQLRGRVPDKDGIYQGDFGDISPFTETMIHIWLDRHGIPRTVTNIMKNE